MIEVVVTCDRCGKTGGDGKSVGIGLSIANTAKAHVCSTCADAFWRWCKESKPKEEKAA